ncbi:MAG: ABC transporter ATP-binding protein [Candidatus Caldarchaeum sp.]
MSETILQVEDLKAYYFTPNGVVKAVDGVSFSVERGRCLAIVGESGCGKSTLVSSILGLLTPPGRIVDGKIIFEGQDLLTKSQVEIRRIRGRKIGMVFQDPMTFLNPLMTSGFQVAETLIEHLNMPLAEAMGKSVGLLTDVQVPDPNRVSRSYPHELSGGMRQRVLIAISLSCNPTLLIADEPTSALDVTIQSQILDLITSFKEKYKMAIIFITHELAIVPRIADEVAVMYAGKIVETGPVAEVMQNPLHPYTQALRNSYARARKQILPSIKGSVPNLANPPPGCRFHPRCPYVFKPCTTLEPGPSTPHPNRTVYCHLYGSEDVKL